MSRRPIQYLDVAIGAPKPSLSRRELRHGKHLVSVIYLFMVQGSQSQETRKLTNGTRVSTATRWNPGPRTRDDRKRCLLGPEGEPADSLERPNGLITHLPVTRNGHNTIFVAVYRCTKMVHLMPTTDKVTAANAVRLFINNVVKLHGVPEDFVSNRDPRFTGKFWQASCQSQGIDTRMSSAFHAETDGHTERVNRILVEMLRNYIDPTHDDWDEHLTAAEFDINNAYQESIKTTPFMLNYGQNPLTPASLRIPRIQNPKVLTLTGTLQERLARAKRFLEAAQQRQRAYVDKGRRPLEFSVGDDVLLSTANISFKRVGALKLMSRYIGPFKVVKRIGATAYELELAKNMRIHAVFHVSLLKSYVPGRGFIRPPPQLTDDGQVEFEVERIMQHKDRRYWGHKSRRWYYVH